MKYKEKMGYAAKLPHGGAASRSGGFPTPVLGNDLWLGGDYTNWAAANRDITHLSSRSYCLGPE